MQHLALASRRLCDRLRLRLAWWLMPAITVAKQKRLLEDIARDSGASWAVSKQIVGRYFRALRDEQ